MKTISILSILLLSLISCGGAPAQKTLASPYDRLPAVSNFTVTSTDVKDGMPFAPAQMSGLFGVAGGQDMSPQLSWSGFSGRDKELRSHYVRSGRPHSQRILALGGRGHPG
jgi:hypothetical protein